MRARGIAYDTGFVRNGVSSIRDFGPDVVRREMQIIRDDLHCNAVHIVGGDAERLTVASRIAADLGLEVWFSPYPIDCTSEETLAFFAECARHAEELRQTGARVVFVTGVELTVMNRGFIPGDTLEARVDNLVRSLSNPAGSVLAEANDRLQEFLREAVATVRAHFRGQMTYAAIQYERVDWDLFDFVTLELMSTAAVAARFREGVRALVSQSKPVAITGFGTATWRGSGEVAPQSGAIAEVDETGLPVRLDGDQYVRDEDEQAKYLRDLLEIFDSEGVDSTFVYLFALHSHPHRPHGDVRDDLDVASFGIVKVFENQRGTTYPDMSWEPKAAFTAVADHYANADKP